MKTKKLRSEIEEILRKWYKGHLTEMPNEYCLDKILSLIKQEIMRAIPPKKEPQIILGGMVETELSDKGIAYNQAIDDFITNLEKVL